jgi:signal transduction histidine kinase
MDQVIDFFKGLFATDKWPARWHCGQWSDFHGWLFIISDLMTWLAYAFIPIIIIYYFYDKVKVIKFSGIYLLFAAFILLCGATHFLDAMMFWIPMYRLNALVRFFTGTVSLFTVYYLFKMLPELFNQKTNVELENEIAKRKEAERKLAEANKELEAFAYVASHDLQAPLRTISGFIKLLENKADQFDENTIKYIGFIQNGAVQMQNLIADILEYSKQSNVGAEYEEVDVNEIIKDIANIHLAIKDALPPIIKSGDIPMIVAQKVGMQQLFANLIGNGIKYQPVGNQPIIQIKMEDQKDCWEFSVSDNGIGIDPSNYEKVFTVFKRLHRLEEYAGTGVGLSICQKIVQRHHGKIWIEPSALGGSTFKFTIGKE